MEFNIGEQIAYYRKLNAMTQEDLAQRLNISTQAVSKWEQKISSPDIMLLPYRTIEDNATLPLLLKGVKKKAARAQVSALFEQFGLEGAQKKYPSQLSGGMRQRAALLRTYMFSKDVALLDEPFSALDTLTKSSMHKWYLNVMDKIQLSTLFITHDIDEAILISDRIYLLSGSPGKIAAEIIIKEPKPRQDGFNLTAEFLEYKRKILSLL